MFLQTLAYDRPNFDNIVFFILRQSKRVTLYFMLGDQRDQDYKKILVLQFN